MVILFQKRMTVVDQGDMDWLVFYTEMVHFFFSLLSWAWTQSFLLVGDRFFFFDKEGKLLDYGKKKFVLLENF